jgi:hypothetical protein
MKTGFGVGEVQCCSGEAAILSVRLQAWIYGALVLAGYRAWGSGSDRSGRRDVGGAAPGGGRQSPGGRACALPLPFRGLLNEKLASVPAGEDP